MEWFNIMRRYFILSLASFLAITVPPLNGKKHHLLQGGRILGGWETNIGDYPYMVSITSSEFDGRNWQHYCGGSLLTMNVVVTACHCLMYDNDPNRGKRPEHRYTVLAGVSDLRMAINGQRRTVIRAEPHPQCNQPSRSNDVGIMELNAPFVPGPGVQPINLYSRDTQTVGATLLQLERDHKNCFATGWGRTDTSSTNPILKVTVASLLESAECARVTCENTLRHCNRNFHDDHMVCASSPDGVTCDADSGGPLVCDGLLVGVVSWKMECRRGWPTMYADLVPILDVASRYLN